LFPLTAPFCSAITNSHTPTTSKTEIQTTKTPPKMMGFVSNLSGAHAPPGILTADFVVDKDFFLIEGHPRLWVSLREADSLRE
jgi:hypothetical protein